VQHAKTLHAKKCPPKTSQTRNLSEMKSAAAFVASARPQLPLDPRLSSPFTLAPSSIITIAAAKPTRRLQRRLQLCRRSSTDFFPGLLRHRTAHRRLAPSYTLLPSASIPVMLRSSSVLHGPEASPSTTFIVLIVNLVAPQNLHCSSISPVSKA
jgi:hypothetical protein